MFGDSKNSESPTIEDIFGLLDKWRHLPAYRLEPRADIYFALYLPEVLTEHLSKPNRLVKINPLLVPEFPIKKALLPTYHGGNDSIKADYLALQESEDGGPAKRRAFLVELKTDMASLNDEQDRDLGHAANVELKELVKGIIDICGSYTKQKPKYVHLLKVLSDLNLVRCEDCLFSGKLGYGKKYDADLKKIRDKIEEEGNWPSSPELVYIQPEKTSRSESPKTTIDFNKFADIIEKDENKDEAIRKSFACCLRKWAKEKAGSLDPRTLHCDRS